MSRHNAFMLINGELIYESCSKKQKSIINPATLETIGTLPEAGDAEIQAAINAAGKAYREWSHISPARRGEMLHKAANEVRANIEAIARLLTLEQGKPLAEALGEIKAAAEALDYYAEEGQRVLGEILPTNKSDTRSLVIRQPLGVVAAFVPWNYPVSLAAWKIAPALAAGNTIIVKPASNTPLATCEFVRLVNSCLEPGGVINLLLGSGTRIGPAFISSPVVQKITLTGSTETGKQIMSLAAPYLKKISLELGGNCPIIVCRDADLEAAAQGTVYRSFRNMGQICNAINRVYVDRAVADTFLEKVLARVSKMTIGDGLRNPDVDLGPMATSEGLEKTLAHLQDAVKKGATVVYGGKRPEKAGPGYFFMPTVLTNVNHQMLVMTEETFGPLAPVMSFSDLEEAVTLANDSPYGLVAYVYTSNLKTAFALSERLQFGTVGINNVTGGEVAFPYGGWKESGLGVELSHHGLNEYLALKHIRMTLL
ncbi:NAD-dependent succinate-semialdehyde dehydrogenase [Moorella sulfitireducens (nom. illeg.)]|uniref:NAD-dependent succinate-semialdehyde dehydrogenase n=1 Tax=Neomoorella sulfitireducens TaxID=2972948 RepID=UPI0021ACC14A|nr:NAD-dependent succinate-semialdehyde dehydrogenase [Moorella sulfitireducens]